MTILLSKKTITVRTKTSLFLSLRIILKISNSKSSSRLALLRKIPSRESNHKPKRLDMKKSRMFWTRTMTLRMRGFSLRLSKIHQLRGALMFKFMIIKPNHHFMLRLNRLQGRGFQSGLKGCRPTQVSAISCLMRKLEDLKCPLLQIPSIRQKSISLCQIWTSIKPEVTYFTLNQVWKFKVGALLSEIRMSQTQIKVKLRLQDILFCVQAIFL